MQKKHNKNAVRKPLSSSVRSGIPIRAGVRAGNQCKMLDDSLGSVPAGAPANVCCNDKQCDFL
ncbi:MAG TPA: hypothetical protein DCM38_03060 [Gammaproteobacteria bacterium]|nr:hypothetical protein [Gammaproteobacteria bacterium]